MEHISYSAIRQFLTSPRKFKQIYIDKIIDDVPMPFLVGKAWHVGLEEFYKGNPNFVCEAILYFDKNKVLQDYEKEKLDKERDMLEANLMKYEAYVKEGKMSWMPTTNKDLIEVSIKETPTFGGIPLKGVIDIFELAGNPVDHKYVSRFTADSDLFKYYVQAWFYYQLTPTVTGMHPDMFIVSEWKKSENRDGTPQIKNHVIKYETKWINKVTEWYKDIYILIKQYEQLQSFPANPFQVYDCKDWTEYLSGVEPSPAITGLNADELGEVEDG
jgi:hypothetical protein